MKCPYCGEAFDALTRAGVRLTPGLVDLFDYIIGKGIDGTTAEELGKAFRKTKHSIHAQVRNLKDRLHHHSEFRMTRSPYVLIRIKKRLPDYPPTI